MNNSLFSHSFTPYLPAHGLQSGLGVVLPDTLAHEVPDAQIALGLAVPSFRRLARLAQALGLGRPPRPQDQRRTDYCTRSALSDASLASAGPSVRTRLQAPYFQKNRFFDFLKVTLSKNQKFDIYLLPFSFGEPQRGLRLGL